MSYCSKIARYESLHQPAYKFVEDFDISQIRSDAGCSLLVVKMVLIDPTESSRGRLHLTFEGVRDLQLRSDPLPFALPLLEIYDISADQWEAIKYKVVETEELRVSFLCADFSSSLNTE